MPPTNFHGIMSVTADIEVVTKAEVDKTIETRIARARGGIKGEVTKAVVRIFVDFLQHSDSENNELKYLLRNVVGHPIIVDT